MTKYRNEKVKTLNSGTFDSKLEFKHFCELQMLERAGKISNLVRQVTIPLGASGRVKYRADFVYYDEVKKSWVIWDSKGFLTKEFLVKKAWLLETYRNVIFAQVSAKSHTLEKCGELLSFYDFSEFIEKKLNKKGGKK